MNVICGKCGKEYNITGHEIGHKCPYCHGENENINNSNKIITCHKCNSSQIHAEKRG